MTTMTWINKIDITNINASVRFWFVNAQNSTAKQIQQKHAQLEGITNEFWTSKLNFLSTLFLYSSYIRHLWHSIANKRELISNT